MNIRIDGSALLLLEDAHLRKFCVRNSLRDSIIFGKDIKDPDEIGEPPERRYRARESGVSWNVDRGPPLQREEREDIHNEGSEPTKPEDSGGLDDHDESEGTKMWV